MGMMTELCAYLKNYFLVDYLNPESRMHYGTYTVSDHDIGGLPFLKNGQFFRIVGSDLNDGVYQYIDDPLHPEMHTQLVDETFTGSIWAMSVPVDVVNLADEIGEWIANNASALNSPYQSESFGGYSYALKSGSGSASGGSDSYGWQSQFAARLAPYRRLSVL